MKSQRMMNGVSLCVALLALIMAFGMWTNSHPGIQAQEAEADPNALQIPLGTAFTYQGYLQDGALPANGRYDFLFVLYNNETGGSQVGDPIYDTLEVTKGQFSLPLNFGNVFTGQKLWLEIRVRPSGSGISYVPLAPRQEITAAPYAIYALNVPAHDHLGLAKAAIFASVGGATPTIHRYFNTIDSVSIGPCGSFPQFWTGCARLNVGFDISSRYWVAMSTGNGHASCAPLVSGPTEVLTCVRYNNSGQPESGDIMVIVY